MYVVCSIIIFLLQSKMTNLLLATSLIGLLSLTTALELNSYCSGRRTASPGNYEVSWQVDENIAYVMFNVSADTTGWVSIGFSENELMVYLHITRGQMYIIWYYLLQADTDAVIGGANAANDMSFVEDRQVMTWLKS